MGFLWVFYRCSIAGRTWQNILRTIPHHPGLIPQQTKRAKRLGRNPKPKRLPSSLETSTCTKPGNHIISLKNVENRLLGEVRIDCHITNIQVKLAEIQHVQQLHCRLGTVSKSQSLVRGIARPFYAQPLYLRSHWHERLFIKESRIQSSEYCLGFQNTSNPTQQKSHAARITLMPAFTYRFSGAFSGCSILESTSE